MLHTTDGLFEPGSIWPPKSEEARLADVSDYDAMFSGDYARPGSLTGRGKRVFGEAFRRIRRDDGTEHVVGINLFRFGIEAHVDLMFGEQSNLRGTDEEDDDPLHEWSERERLWAQMPEVVTDAKKSGDGYLRCVPDGGKARLSVVSPEICFPVVAADDVRKEIGFVVAWKWSVKTRTMLGREKDSWFGIAEIHGPGYYDRIELSYDDKGEKVVARTAEKRYKTGYPGLAIVHVCGPNRRTNAYHGTSELADIDGIIAEVEVRAAQIARILDKHAQPTPNIPASALKQDPQTGELVLKMGEAIVLDDKDDVAMSYSTWDGNLESAFKMHDMMVRHYCRQAHVAPVLFDPDKASGVTSGAAWKRAMSAMLAYVARWRQALDPCVMEVAKIAATIEKLPYDKLDIEWADGLPDDPLEIAQTVALKRAAGVQSVESAVSEVSDKTGDALTAEVDAIEAEKGSAAPSVPPPPKLSLVPPQDAQAV